MNNRIPDAEIEAALRAVADLGMALRDSNGEPSNLFRKAMRAALEAAAKVREAAPREEMEVRNARVKARYDELMREGKHGHYETMFRVVREEVERAQAAPQ